MLDGAVAVEVGIGVICTATGEHFRQVKHGHDTGTVDVRGRERGRGGGGGHRGRCRALGAAVLSRSARPRTTMVSEVVIGP